jgi:hypothetical protein
MTHNWPTQPIYLVHLYMVKVKNTRRKEHGSTKNKTSEKLKEYIKWILAHGALGFNFHLLS